MNEIAEKYIAVGKGKVALPVTKMFVLGILAGAFIGFGAVASTTVGVSVAAPSVAKLLGAMVFPAGLAMVILAGSELFTGNCLLVIPLLDREITGAAVLRNWLIVYCGNLVGGIAVAALCVFGNQAGLFDGEVGAAMISTAVAKTSMGFGEAFLKGIACNFLVCIAVWMALGAKEAVSKVAAIYLPIMTFVLCGFEHSVANMYFISAGLFAKKMPQLVAAGADLSSLTWVSMFVDNLLPVTLGNIVGGCLVGVIYWYVCLHGKSSSK